MLFAVAAVFGLTWWLGLYVIVRDPGERGPRRAGLGLLAYGLALAAGRLRAAAGDSEVLAAAETVLAHLPVLLWTGAVLTLVPGSERLDRAWSRGLVPITAAALAWLTITGWDSEAGAGEAAVAGAGVAVRAVTGVLLLVPLAGVLALLVRARPPRVGGLVTVATLFFGLGAALLVFPLLDPAGPVGTLAVLAIDVDMALLGVAIAMSSAFQAGEALWRDMLRSLLGAVVVMAASGGQVALAIVLGGTSPALAALLFGVVAVAVAVQTLAGPVHRALDRIAFPGDRELRRERAELRDSAEALPRREQGPPPLDEAEFTRLTRRALAGYGDLGKLASSPLANLPVIDKRVTGDSPLERAAELRTLLLESIRRLKPRDGEFGTSEEWRFYNVLYFPYVRGLRPYRRGAGRGGLGPEDRQAFDWFLREVPERTLYNWQNAAAKLVADDLRTENRQ
ncbi:hypothetical protein [Planomonospora venezuelensis]|uniref:Uncharacterized protein n=1 Tax=Planomonospora venezuelensis TaxID=1999 RepID=A0A841CXQ0_PLAVE|nr:hypothetical protein [Planomonospora venezuelensis]MBB5960898.1 hypothetical protein [Planomonospora venezuelensis]GIN01133.1 hypothetical protein Pve01_27910 [Planomonospora venezuelensis]